MAFHFFMLGPLSAQVQEYTDKSGLVPEAQDRWQDLYWTRRLKKQFSDPQSGEAAWEAFRSKAITDVARAFQKLRDMEWSNRCDRHNYHHHNSHSWSRR